MKSYLGHVVPYDGFLKPSFGIVLPYEGKEEFPRTIFKASGTL